MRLLLLESDDVLHALSAREWLVERLSSGEQALDAVIAQRIDLIISAGALADMDATQFCRRLRAAGAACAVIVVTATHDASERIALFDAGADDVVAKPVDAPELAARVRAVLRRCGGAPPILRVGDIVIDSHHRKVTVNGDDVGVTDRECALLTYLAQRAGEVVSRNEISRDVWKSTQAPASNIIDVNIRHLRTKLGEAAQCLQTVRGKGYVLAVCSSK